MEIPRMKTLMTAAALALGMATALPAAAQFQRPGDAVKYRQGGFAVMGHHFARIGAMAQGRVPFDAAAAQANADIVATLAALPFNGFIDGTADNSRAKPVIWSQRSQFDGLARDMQEEVLKLQAAARTGDLALLRASFGSAAASCKACHDTYRE
jgi:cytochrome c556